MLCECLVGLDDIVYAFCGYLLLIIMLVGVVLFAVGWIGCH